MVPQAGYDPAFDPYQRSVLPFSLLGHGAGCRNRTRTPTLQVWTSTIKDKPAKLELLGGIESPRYALRKRCSTLSYSSKKLVPPKPASATRHYRARFLSRTATSRYWQCLGDLEPEPCH